MAQLTFYSEPSPGATVASDGTVLHSNINGLTWAEVLALTTGSTPSTSGTTIEITLQSDGNANEYDTLGKGFLHFDTSSIPDGATIDSAIIQGWPTAILDEFAEPFRLGLVASTTASDISLTGADYDNHGTEPLANALVIAGISVGSLQTLFTLNTAGKAHINKTGVTKFCMLDADLLPGGAEPTWTADGIDRRLLLASTEQVAARRPRLIVDYTESGIVPLISPRGIGQGMSRGISR